MRARFILEVRLKEPVSITSLTKYIKEAIKHYGDVKGNNVKFNVDNLETVFAFKIRRKKDAERIHNQTSA